MKLSAPTLPVFWIAVALAVLSLLVYQSIVPSFGVSPLWLMTAGFVVLAVGNLFKGL